MSFIHKKAYLERTGIPPETLNGWIRRLPLVPFRTSCWPCSNSCTPAVKRSLERQS